MKTIIIDSSHPLANNNQCFDPLIENKGYGFAFLVRLANEVRKRGHRIITADVFERSEENISNAILITDMYSSNTDNLISKHVVPYVCYSLESPLIAQKFYHNLIKYGGKYRYNYQFRGTQERLKSTNTIFRSIVFPVETRITLPLTPWDKRNYAIIVNSNKRVVKYNIKNIKDFCISLGIDVRYKIWKHIDPFLNLPELYIDRVKAINFFSNIAGFHLYGFGWNEPIQGFSTNYNKSIQRCYKGIIPDGKKRQVISSYKFCICFENTIFPGYITEKITDCFLAGCIPVYLGAPDITDFIPADCFIDYRNFSSFQELNDFLLNLSEKQAMKYIEAAHDFLSSKKFDQFDLNILIDEWCNILLEK